MVRTAYRTYADDHVDLTRPDMPLEGGPAWVRSDRYTINAIADGDQSREVIYGRMLRALLEERFRLEIGRETREVPVYELTLAKSGAKLEPFREGGCVPQDFTRISPDENRCRSGSTRDGSNLTVDGRGLSINAFMRIFLANLDRPVINRTGLTGLFNYHMVYEENNASPGKVGEASDPASPLLFDALERQLGLKLVSAKGPREFLVINHVERPSSN